MEGNVVYIICEYMIREGVRQIHSVHATFDGANAKLNRLKEINQNAGYKVFGDFYGGVLVYGDKGLVYEYYVSTRTIEK